MLNKKTMAILIVIILVLAGLGYVAFQSRRRTTTYEFVGPVDNRTYVNWQQPYVFNKQGYEPGLVSDSTGTMYYTAHKNLDDKMSWEYLASWFFISNDNGETWYSPTDPFPRGAKWKTFTGDEGDIAVDGRDYVYYVDTYLIDNHLHVWANQGEWQYSERIQKSSGLDDRPWISAQGNGILHYLGNNGVEVGGGRYWYYRSVNGGRTWQGAQPVPGNGWGLVDAERDGDHVYVISESEVDAAADILVYVSNDQGATWDWNNPVKIAHRDGPGREYPIVCAGPDGQVWALWNDATNADENGTQIFVGWSSDYGQSWSYSNITPFHGYFDYPALNMGPDGSLGVAFYATDDLPLSDESEWYVMGAMQRDPIHNELMLNFSRADPEPVYVGSNTHALHDFFEIAVTPDGALNVAYQYYVGPENGHSDLYFVRGDLNRTAPQI